MQTDKDEITNILNILNEYLEQTKFIAANHLTIADFSILANVATIIVRYVISRPRAYEIM